ncbi:DUF2384 domain-containing protein [Planosporangium thailandense]|uniref:DUF2384 domain-containing protein n=1 Tax=Planosporangium thailandense TaxID=765197 RepID=A0ABX0XYL6_9ACTN|nr:antitoxin Xre/MbcA/ParS toxin-binding domain-containing protein [Planosporangium thailandense]NJC70362.1 DUF2384 domain-containing protein [Planosporangium thailandense]
MERNAVYRPVTVPDSGLTEPVGLEECALAYGRDLLAYLLAAGVDGPLTRWRLDPDTVEYGWDRLRVCHRVLELLAEPRLARAWLRRPSPRLSGHTPAWAVRTGDPVLLSVVEREAERLRPEQTVEEVAVAVHRRP